MLKRLRSVGLGQYLGRRSSKPMSGVRGGWGVGKGTHKRGERAHCSSSFYLVRVLFFFFFLLCCGQVHTNGIDGECGQP